MEHNVDQVPKNNKTNSLPKIVFAVVGISFALCGLIALGIFYKFRHPYWGPKSQIVLEPDYSLVAIVNPAELENDTQILTARSNALGTRITFVVTENNQIIAQVPTSRLSQNLIEKTIAIGLLELVDFGKTPIQPGITIATDFGYKYFPQAEGTKWHTLITNAEFESVDVEQDKFGKYQFSFKLTANGAKILSDYTTNNVGHYLGIVMDKIVISVPKVDLPITNGSGVIASSLTQEQAESLEIYLHIKGPLPIPLKIKQISESGK